VRSLPPLPTPGRTVRAAGAGSVPLGPLPLFSVQVRSSETVDRHLEGTAWNNLRSCRRCDGSTKRSPRRIRLREERSDSARESATLESTTSADGTTIGYLRRGSGPALVTTHGSIATSEQRIPATDHFAQHFTCFVHDRRGRGRSGDASTYDLSTEVTDIAAIMACSVPKLSRGPMAWRFSAAQAIRRYSLITPPRTRSRRIGVLSGMTHAGSWLGGR
jgi:hypothetical protein